MSLMMLAACGGSTPVTQTFNSSQTWVAPASIASVATLTGKGGTGYPGGDWEGTHTHYTYTTRYYNGAQVGSRVFGYVGSFPGRRPANYCDPLQEDVSINTTHNQVCHYFYDNTEDTTTGGTTTALGKSFAGGVGAPATPATHNDVAVTPGGSYPLVIPAGGSISITYYQ